MKIFEYVRVSSKEQNVVRQIETMKAEGIGERDMFIDKLRRKDFNRQKYQLLKQIVREGDTVVFDSITRMGRNMNETMNEYDWFVKNGVQQRFIKEPMINTSNEQEDIIKLAIQKDHPYIAEKERDEIKTRQAEGIAEANKKGVKFGRPAVAMPRDRENYYKQWKANKITAVQFMESLGMAKATFYSKVEEYENKSEFTLYVCATSRS